MTSSWPSWGYILPIIIFSFCFNIPKFFELQVKTLRTDDGSISLCQELHINEEYISDDIDDPVILENLSSDNCNESPFDDSNMVKITVIFHSLCHGIVQVEKIAATSLRMNPIYIKLYLIYLNFFIHGVIPFTLLITLNIAIYRQVSTMYCMATLQHYFR